MSYRNAVSRDAGSRSAVPKSLRIRGIWDICLDYIREELQREFRLHCGRNDLKRSQYLYNLLGLTLVDVRSQKNSAFRQACGKGYETMARWIWGLGLTIEDVRSSKCHAFRWACENGHVSVVHWLWDLGLTLEDIRMENNHAFRSICSRNSIRMARWLWSLGLTLEDAQVGYDRVFEYDDRLKMRPEFGPLEMWLLSIGCECNSRRS